MISAVYLRYYIMLFQTFLLFSFNIWIILSLTADELSPLLLVAAVRVVVSTSCYQLSFPCTLYLDEGSVDRSSALSQLLCYLPRELSLDNNEIPLRSDVNKFGFASTHFYMYLSWRNGLVNCCILI